MSPPPLLSSPLLPSPPLSGLFPMSIYHPHRYNCNLGTLLCILYSALDIALQYCRTAHNHCRRLHRKSCGKIAWLGSPSVFPVPITYVRTARMNIHICADRFDRSFTYPHTYPAYLRTYLTWPACLPTCLSCPVCPPHAHPRCATRVEVCE